MDTITLLDAVVENMEIEFNNLIDHFNYDAIRTDEGVFTRVRYAKLSPTLLHATDIIGEYRQCDRVSTLDETDRIVVSLSLDLIKTLSLGMRYEMVQLKGNANLGYLLITLFERGLLSKGSKKLK